MSGLLLSAVGVVPPDARLPPSQDLYDSVTGASRGRETLPDARMTIRNPQSTSKEREKCDYVDACNKKPLTVAKGDTFVDSCNKKYQVQDDCKLKAIKCHDDCKPKATKCHYSDACNKRPLSFDVGDTFVDSCANKYLVQSGCKLKLEDMLGCSFIDHCNRSTIYQRVGKKLIDSCGKRYLVKPCCMLEAG